MRVKVWGLVLLSFFGGGVRGLGCRLSGAYGCLGLMVEGFGFYCCLGLMVSGLGFFGSYGFGVGLPDFSGCSWGSRQRFQRLGFLA